MQSQLQFGGLWFFLVFFPFSLISFFLSTSSDCMRNAIFNLEIPVLVGLCHNLIIQKQFLVFNISPQHAKCLWIREHFLGGRGQSGCELEMQLPGCASLTSSFCTRKFCLRPRCLLCSCAYLQIVHYRSETVQCRMAEPASPSHCKQQDAVTV